MKYEIWRLPVNHPCKFRSSSSWSKKEINLLDYVRVYSGEEEKEIDDIDCFLENLFHKFNIDHPEDYRLESMSVSDVICLIGNCDKRFWFYVDNIGFTEIRKRGGN